ncbi:Protein of unknown function [Cotesia congregata]|uniref:Uncharacterized protein n=1 Tax=Cotesia congregata TaxID=51543 RepID=A0A8J2MAQ0_COTCN|nr:Protein of unknown function [Cotesia congregata]
MQWCQQLKEKIPIQYLKPSKDVVEIGKNAKFYLPLDCMERIQDEAQQDWRKFIRETLDEVYGENICNFSAKGKKKQSRPAIDHNLILYFIQFGLENTEKRPGARHTACLGEQPPNIGQQFIFVPKNSPFLWKEAWKYPKTTWCTAHGSSARIISKRLLNFLFFDKKILYFTQIGLENFEKRPGARHTARLQEQPPSIGQKFIFVPENSHILCTEVWKYPAMTWCTSNSSSSRKSSKRLLKVHFFDKKSFILHYLAWRTPREDLVYVLQPAYEKNLPALRELVEICFVNNSNPVVISEDLLDNNWDPGGNPLIVIDRKFDKQITGFLPTYPMYVLVFKSIDELKVVINNLQKSTFWNIKSPFLIVETNSHCLSTKTILKFMWKRNLMAVYHLCYQKNSTVVFTLNPFASYAPAPWELIAEFDDDDGKKMTLYRLQYTKDPEVCKSIIFDKTDHLDNAEVKTSKFTTLENVFINETFKRLYSDEIIHSKLKSKYMTLHQLSLLMNITSTIDLIPNVKIQELLKQGYVKELADEIYDIHDQILPIEATKYKYVDVMAYYHEMRFSILTKKTNFLTVFNDVTNDVRFVVGTIVLFIMFTIVMFIINKDNVCLAMMDVVRLVLSMTLETPLNRLVMKFILFFGFLFAFLIVPDFQGHVSAILSKPLGRNVETLKDLFENKFHVYYYDRLEYDIINEQLWVSDEDKKYLHPLPENEMIDCIKAVPQNSTIACIFRTKASVGEASELKHLHVSKKNVFKKLMVYWARKNWPLKNKFEEIARVTAELGFSRYIKLDNSLKKKQRELKKKKQKDESREYKQFDYDNLIFNYHFLGYFIMFGLIVFVIEILFDRYI